MLTRIHNGYCECHGGPAVRVYQYHAFRYCLMCLHSIGINAAGNYCTPAQYAAAWKKLAS